MSVPVQPPAADVELEHRAPIVIVVERPAVDAPHHSILVRTLLVVVIYLAVAYVLDALDDLDAARATVQRGAVIEP